MTSELRERYKRWIKYFRQNPEEFAEQVLGINLLPYQKYAVHNMLMSDSSFFLASRGSAKSFLTAVVAIVYALLYPGAKVVVSASTEAQASLLITSKIKTELIDKLSPYLREMNRNGLINIGRTDAGAAMIEFTTNGSSIIGCAPIASSRGLRCSLLILDEARLMSQQSISSILLPMRAKRVPVYSEDQTDFENAKVILLTSSGYSYEPWTQTFKQHFIRAAQPSERQRLKYCIISMDIYACVQQGIKSLEDLESLKENTDAQSFAIEMENQILGSISDGFFDAGQFIPQQKITCSLKREKTEDEWRIICQDLAFQSADNNDHTIIICASIDTITGMKRIDYIQQWEASDTNGLAIRTHELYEQYQADIICWDSRSGGRVYAQMLMQPISIYDGFGLADGWLQRVSSKTLEDYLEYQIDNPVDCPLVPYIASSQSNSNMWLSLMSSLQQGKWLFPKSAADAENIYMESGEFYKMDSEQYANLIAPHIQTDILISEAINLKAEHKNNLLHLREPRNKTKDRIVCLGYCNDVMDTIANNCQQVKYEHDSWLQDFPVYW